MPNAQNKKKMAICITIYEKGGQGILIEEIHKHHASEYEMTIICEKCTREVNPVFKIVEEKAWFNRYIPWLNKNLVEKLKNFDVIHCYDSISYMHAASKTGKPYVVTSVGMSPFFVRGTVKGMVDAILCELIYAWGYPKVTKIVAFSKYLKIWLKERYNVESTLINLGVDRSVFYPTHTKQVNLTYPHFLYSGQISEKKGCDDLIYGLAQLKKELPNFTFKLLGFGEDYYLKKFSEAINAYGLENNVEIVGFVPNKELPNYYNDCDVFVTPSRWEGFGMPILEAMACGKPCVALNKYNTKYLIEDSNGGTVFNNKHDIHTAILKCLEDYDFYAKNALEFASLPEFRWETHAQALLNIYSELYT